MFKQALLFPLASAINLFSVTGLLILSGLLGNADLAADIAIVQGSILAVFHSLSANARNIILAIGSSPADEKNLFYFRFVTLIPAIVAAYFLTNIATQIPAYLFYGLVLRKCCDWLAELQLANREIGGDFGFARRYVWLNSLSFVVLVSSLALSSQIDSFRITLFVWALLPAIYSLDYLRYIFGLNQIKLNFSQLIPHMGSTTVIGISNYIFRVLIVLLVGKSIAGQMFSAYAIGGVLSSLYVYALGPTLVLREQHGNNRALSLIVIGCFLLGGLLIASSLFWDQLIYAPIFVNAIGFSLVGGGVMILAQRQRLYILQVHNQDVFVPDALSNILLIGLIPFVYYLVGVEIVPAFFLLSAILAFLFYIPLSYKSRLKC